ncbi:MAG: S9 family peptidase [Acidimicrobiia bacterium]
MAKGPVPPAAPRRPHVLRAHGDERVDDWYWLRERDDPDVLAYLEAENAFTETALQHTEALQKELYAEIVNRVLETDVSAAAHRGAWDYFVRTYEGSQYAVHGRRPRGAAVDVDERVLLDENELAAGHDFFSLGGASVSPDQRLLAYAVDFSGGERHELRIRDLETGLDLDDLIPDTYYGLAWANDNRTLFYVRPDEAVRPFQVLRHTLGTPTSHDVVVFRDDDEYFFVNVERTRTGRYILLSSDSKTTSEVWFVDADAPTDAPRLIAAREPGIEYTIDHHGAPAATRGPTDRFLVLTNADGAANFKLQATPVETPDRSHWTDVVPHSPEVRLEDVDAFAHHLVLSERTNGLERLRVLDLADPGASHTIEMPDPVYSVWSGANLEFETTTLRYEYTSLVHPVSSYDYDLTTRERTLVKQQEVLGGYDPSAYTSARLWATASDGTRIPISVVHRNDVALDGSAPAMLYGYGSYEVSIEPSFSSVRLSLLDRGFVYAIAHIRGGGEMGRAWYEDGRLANKTNTFTDFIASAETLIDAGYTSPQRLAARGASAGGLLMGAISNLRPDLFRVIVAQVPFVDAVTTMLDDNLPLTITEWEEWGNPVEDPRIYTLMKSYSPYDNIEAKEYPALLVTGGLNDPRVQYWEPAKWVAKLRATKTGNRALLLKTEMGAGHGGPSGRYDAWRDEALVLAFVIDQLDIEERTR